MFHAGKKKNFISPDDFMVPETGLEPVQGKAPRDFKSLASANSATPAIKSVNSFQSSVVSIKKLLLKTSLTAFFGFNRFYIIHNRV